MNVYSTIQSSDVNLSCSVHPSLLGLTGNNFELEASQLQLITLEDLNRPWRRRATPIESPFLKEEESNLFEASSLQNGEPSSTTLLEKEFVIPSDNSVSVFIGTHRTVSSLLIKSAPKLREYLGSNIVLTLKAVTDAHGWQTLYAVAQWPGDPMEAIARLDRFDDWWLENSNSTSGSVNFTYELV